MPNEPLYHCLECGCFYEDAITTVLATLHGQQSDVIQLTCAMCVKQLVKAEAAALREACETLLAWLNEIWPPNVFTGISGDPGAVRVAEIRSQARAALAADAGRAMLERVKMLEEELELATRIVRPLEQLHPLDDK